MNFNALDIDSGQRVRNLLIKFKEEDKTTLLTSNNQENINICDEVLSINQTLHRKSSAHFGEWLIS